MSLAIIAFQTFLSLTVFNASCLLFSTSHRQYCCKDSKIFHCSCVEIMPSSICSENTLGQIKKDMAYKRGEKKIRKWKTKKVMVSKCYHLTKCHNKECLGGSKQTFLTLICRQKEDWHLPVNCVIHIFISILNFLWS